MQWHEWKKRNECQRHKKQRQDNGTVCSVSDAKFNLDLLVAQTNKQNDQANECMASPFIPKLSYVPFGRVTVFESYSFWFPFPPSYRWIICDNVESSTVSTDWMNLQAGEQQWCEEQKTTYQIWLGLNWFWFFDEIFWNFKRNRSHQINKFILEIGECKNKQQQSKKWNDNDKTDARIEQVNW